jgi:hypothetical protein
MESGYLLNFLDPGIYEMTKILKSMYYRTDIDYSCPNSEARAFRVSHTSMETG